MVSTYRATQTVLLRGMALVYLCAFWSTWLQLPELYSADGLLPVHSFLAHQSDRSPSFYNLLGFHDALGLRADVFLECLCLSGVGLAVLAALGLTIAPVYLLLWMLYSSVFMVGQQFLHFQWDVLLLETGVAAVFLAPMTLSKAPVPMTGIVLFRVTLFKLMFMSGIVKLQSRCPTWQELTALDYHYATQCLPTPLGWYAHQLPANLQQASVALMFVVQLPAAFMVLVALRGVRVVAAWAQILLQTLILLTGNYNWFNALTILLSVSLLDDDLWPVSLLAHAGDRPWPRRRILRVAKYLQILGAVAALLFAGLQMFDCSLTDEPHRPLWARVRVRWALSVAQISQAVPRMLQVACALAAVAFAYYSVRQLWGLYTSLRRRGAAAVGPAVWHVVAMAGCAYVVAINAIPLETLVETRDGTFEVPALVRDGYISHVISGYGLFRRMTGVGPGKEVARPEVVLEGSRDGSVWLEYEFRYKPGNVTKRPVFVAPHQPRLDWQMWFAALGSYQQNPWLLHLCYKLLAGAPLSGRLVQGNPFPDAPPKYIRASLWHYKFTAGNQTDWWERERVREYLPVVTKENLQGVLDRFRWNDAPGPAGAAPFGIEAVLRVLRANEEWSAPFLCAAVGLGLLVRTSRRRSAQRPQSPLSGNSQKIKAE